MVLGETLRPRLAKDTISPGARASAMRRANPAFIPCNHRMEEAIDAAVCLGDFGPFEWVAHVLARPSDDQPDHADLAAPPGREQGVSRTFCGT